MKPENMSRSFIPRYVFFNQDTILTHIGPHFSTKYYRFVIARNPSPLQSTSRSQTRESAERILCIPSEARLMGSVEATTTLANTASLVLVTRPTSLEIHGSHFYVYPVIMQLARESSN